MNIYLYKLAKRVNSTKRPAGSGTLFECTLKQPTSIMTPDILINLDNMTNIPDFNYAYIPQFNRYYHITDITSMGHIWSLSMICDVLATYRTDIGSAQLYMLRSTAAWDGKLVDNYYPLSVDHTIATEETHSPWLTPSTGDPEPSEIDITRGLFVLGVLAKPYSTGAGSYGSMKYLILDRTRMIDFITKLMDNTIIQPDFDPQDASLSLQKSLINPLSYIKSCLWFPLEYTSDLINTLDLTTTDVWDWSIDADCKLMLQNPPYVYQTVNLTIPKHPQSASRGMYLNIPPYTQLKLFIPPFGLVDLDAASLVDAEYVNVRYCVDLIKGTCTAEIYASNQNDFRYNLLQKIDAQLGVPIQLTEISYDYTNLPATITGLAAEAANTFLGNLMPSGISSAVSQIGNAANALRQSKSSMGSNGSFNDLRGRVILYANFHNIVDEDFGHVGRPLCKLRTASSGSSGDYYLAREGDLAISGATSAEQESIKGFLESGFFWE